MQLILNLTDTKGGDYFCKSYKYAFDNNIKPLKNNFNGKISFIKDPECKLRIIAISDYFSQFYLKYINDSLFNLIKRSSLKICDRTFTQDPTHCWESNEEDY